MIEQPYPEIMVNNEEAWREIANYHFATKILNEFVKAAALVARKNKDYANDLDPYKNFRISEQAGVPLAQGILVRMFDKMSRLSNLITKPPQVNSESIGDTLIDLANYAMIMKTYLDEIAFIPDQFYSQRANYVKQGYKEPVAK